VAITATTLRLTKRLRRDLLAVTNQIDRDLTKAWVEAWDTVSLDLEAAINELAANTQGGMLSRATILRSRRLQYALEAIAQALTRLAEAAGIRITDDLPGVVRSAGEAQAAIIDSQIPKAERDKLVGWDRMDPKALDAIVRRSTERITSGLWPLSSEADAVIRRELVRGIATGSNPRAVASNIMKGAEGGFNGGLARALTVSRTEIIDAHRAAAKVSHDANEEVLGGWVWLTNLSPRTCPACLGMNGTEHPLTEPGPLGHANCRCSRMPRTKTWAELGIEGMDEPSPVTPDAGEWFAAQDHATQRGILGAARYDAWKRGDYPISTWAVRKDNPEWRASYQTSPLPKTR
jgi:hypothetical protein